MMTTFTFIDLLGSHFELQWTAIECKFSDLNQLQNFSLLNLLWNHETTCRSQVLSLLKMKSQCNIFAKPLKLQLCFRHMLIFSISNTFWWNSEWKWQENPPLYTIYKTYRFTHRDLTVDDAHVSSFWFAVCVACLVRKKEKCNCLSEELVSRERDFCDVHGETGSQQAV